VFEWTDPAHPVELAFYDRGPLPPGGGGGGFWSAYWYNGHIIGSEMKRGLDIFELTPSPAITQNEIDAAKTVQAPFLNVQDQQKFVWPATFALARAYADQLERSNGLPAASLATVRSGLNSAEGMSVAQRKAALTRLATQVSGFAGTATDKSKAQMLATAVKDLAAATK
jgi:hypothetical protein